MSREEEIERGTMKALAIRQPYAWLVAQGIKDVENRKWSTRYRGPFLIHATKAIDEEEVSQERSRLSREGIVLPDDLPLGGIVGIATLVDCVQYVDVSWWRQFLDRLLRKHPSPDTIAQPDSIWFEGPYGFILEDARPLPFKPWRGQQKFFNVPDDLYGPELKT